MHKLKTETELCQHWYWFTHTHTHTKCIYLYKPKQPWIHMPSRVSTNQHFNTPAAVCDMYSLGFMGALIKTIGENVIKNRTNRRTSASSWLLLLEVMLKIVKHQKLMRKLNLKYCREVRSHQVCSPMLPQPVHVYFIKLHKGVLNFCPQSWELRMESTEIYTHMHSKTICSNRKEKVNTFHRLSPGSVYSKVSL